MKLIIEKHALVAALTHVAPIAASKGTIAIIANVLLTAQDGKLTMRTTNLDMEIVASCPAAIETLGETTVNVVRLFDIARNMPAGSQILFEIGDDPRMKVSAGRSRFMLPTVTPRDFPVLEATDYPVNINIPAIDFAGALNRTTWAQSNEAIRYYLCGTHLVSTDTGLRFEASNGHVCGISDIPELPGSGGINTILPTSATAAMSRLVEGQSGDIILHISPTRASLTFGSVTLSTKLIDMPFPDITRVIPRDLPHLMTVDADILVDAVRRVAGVSDDKIPAINLSFSENIISVSSRGTDGEEGSDEVEAHYDGEDVRVRFTTDYVLGALAALNADVLEIQVGSNKTAQIWRSVGNSNAMALLMPRLG